MRARAPRNRRLALPAAALLGLSLLLSGCGVNEAAAAAVVDGRVISDKDVQLAAAETNEGVEGLSTPFTAKSTLPWLILAPYILGQAEKEGKAVSASQAREVLTKLPNPSPATVEFVRAYIAAQSSLSQEGVQAVLDQLGEASVKVNPRYGTFDPQSPAELVATKSDWVKSATPAQTTAPEVPNGRPQDGP